MTDPSPEYDAEPAFRVRPYTLTGGRTSSMVVFPMDAQVRMTSASIPDGLGPGQRRVLDLIGKPIAVAEVAARAEIPLPVAQVLIGDLAEFGLVTVDDTFGDNDRPDIQLLRTVLEGLQPG